MAQHISEPGKKLTNLQKAAVVVVSLGPEKSSEILSHLSGEEVGQIAREVARLNDMDNNTRESALEEFSRRCSGLEEKDHGGLELAKELVRRAVGPQKATQILDMLNLQTEDQALSYLQNVNTNDLARLLADEHPQISALVLSNIMPQKAALVLKSLVEDKRAEVACRIAQSNLAIPNATQRLAKALELKASSMPTEEVDVEAGKKRLIEILKNADRNTERIVMKTLSDKEPELADLLRDKLFVFEDLVKLDSKSVQLLIRELDNEDLRIALRAAADDVKEAFFKNMSENARLSLQEELDTGQPIRLREVEERQQKIAGVLRKLVEAGTIVIGEEEEEEFV